MDKSIDFQIELSSNQEDIQMAGDDEVDLYGDLSIVLLANDQPDVLDYFEDLSDLSGDEFLEEYSTKAEPAAQDDDMSNDLSDDELLEDTAEAAAVPDNDMPELSFSEEELLEDFGDPMFASTRPSSPVDKSTATPAQPDDNDIQLAGVSSQPEQGCDPAVLHRTEKDLEEILAKLPFRPLQATIERWRLRTASPSMKDYIRRIRREIDAEGPSKFFLPWNLRDTINVKKERLLAQGPYMNRKFLIESYRLKKVQEQWSKLDEQHEQ